MPRDLLAVLAVFDGQSGSETPILLDGYRFLPSARIVEFARNTAEATVKTRRTPKLTRNYGPVKGYTWNKKWIPFAMNYSGDILCLDTDPTPEGVVGQVISVMNGDTDLRVLNDRLVDYVGGYDRLLESGDVNFNDVYRVFVLREEE